MAVESRIVGFHASVAITLMLGAMLGSVQASGAGCGCTAQGTATYRVTFVAGWGDPTPPFNANPHWSPIVGTSHDACYVMWRSNQNATRGIEDMAELGRTMNLYKEFDSAGANALSRFAGPSIATANGSASNTFTVDRYHPLISVTSMVFPSPDWFVGVDSMNLCDGSNWMPELQVLAYPWDAGTDSGPAFTSPNADTDPAQPIARITTSSSRTTSYAKATGSTAPMGYFRFTSESVNTTASGSNPMCSQCGTQAPATTPSGCGCSASGTATYSVTFSPDWTDPTPPSNPHWSPAIGTSHNPCYTMWRSGIKATPGVQSMAEFGNTKTVSGEFMAAGENTLTTFQGQLINSAKGETVNTFEADPFHSLVSVTSMIAPSPDWFVGVDSLDLCNGSSWIQSVTVDAYPWDAGTDSGQAFDANNLVTSPQQLIARITATSSRTSVFRKTSGTTARMGTFKFERMSVDTSKPGSPTSCSMCSPGSTDRSSTSTLLPSVLVAGILLLSALVM